MGNYPKIMDEKDSVSSLPHGAAALDPATKNNPRYAAFTLDGSGLIETWNPGVGRVLGYEPDEFVGRHVSLIFTPEDAESGEIERELRQASAAGFSEEIKWHVRRDHSRFLVNSFLTPLSGADGNINRYVKILRDGAGRKTFESGCEVIAESVRQARREADSLRFEIERKEQEKDEFLALLAHELRGPLNAISGWVKILRTGMTDERQTAKALEIIEKSAMLQNRLIEDVFDAARISSGKLHLDLRPMSLGETVNQAVELIRPAAESKFIALETRAFSDSAFIMGDHDRIQQVITNILSNAVKFTPEGGRIDLSLECAGTSAQLVIKDSGQGISAELLPNVFERFAQAGKDSARGKTGLGLGLPLAYRLVGRHRGDIKAESAGEGQGATFTINLPLIEV
jgi:PAS domain S-box-containing protein